MKLRKSFFWILIASQAALGTAIASANTVAPQASAQSPEFTLVENVLALQGAKLSTTDLQNQANSLVSNYLATAQTTGSQQRFQQALVALGVYTPQQAQTFVTDAQNANAHVLAAQPVTSAQTQNLVSNEMSQLAALHPDGAQFAGIDPDTLSCVGTVAAGVGIVAVLTGLILRYDNPTCTTQTYGGYAWVNDVYTYVTLDGPTTCTQANYYPNAQSGDDVMIGGAILTGVGALLMVLSGEGGC